MPAHPDDLPHRRPGLSSSSCTCLTPKVWRAPIQPFASSFSSVETSFPGAWLVLFLYLSATAPTPTTATLSIFSPESPARPCIQGLQLADEFIRPKALPRSMTAFRPTRRTSGGPWWSLGTHHGHWRRDKKVPQCPLNVCVFTLGAHFLERHFVH